MAPPAYQERLGVPGWWWALAAVLVLVLGAELHAGFRLSIVIGIYVVAAAITAALLVFAGATRVAVEDGTLVAGRARLPLAVAGEVAVLEGERLRVALGPRADPAAYVVIRPWLHHAVLVPVVDPADPTPYWLVGTRHPERLATAISVARSPA